MILEIIRWYGIILLGIASIGNLWECIKKRSFEKFISFLIPIPIIVYLIIK